MTFSIAFSTFLRSFALGSGSAGPGRPPATDGGVTIPMSALSITISFLVTPAVALPTLLNRKTVVLEFGARARPGLGGGCHHLAVSVVDSVGHSLWFAANEERPGWSFSNDG